MILVYKDLQTRIVVLTIDKVTELFCKADVFCRFFEIFMSECALKPSCLGGFGIRKIKWK